MKLTIRPSTCQNDFMGIKVLTDAQRYKLDQEPDRVFYSEPRFVQHLDEGFRAKLTSFYRQHIPSGSIILDLGSSWVSHLPDDIHYERIIGHGMNEAELSANPRLDCHYVQDMNLNPTIPLEDESVDACLAVAAWQYWTQPEDVAAEMLRVTRPNGTAIIAFSNRMFFTKAPQVWTDSNDQQHLDYVGTVLQTNGWSGIRVFAEETKAKGLIGLIGAKGDPFFAVVGRKSIT